MLKIISGGQTGVDRAALDAALEQGVPCGGWCPEGRRAEDGPIPERYPLREVSGGGYKQRTLQNIRDSDGTVMFYFGHPRKGTENALFFCLKKGKPYLLIDAIEIPPGRAVERSGALSRSPVSPCSMSPVQGPARNPAPTPMFLK